MRRTLPFLVGAMLFWSGSPLPGWAQEPKPGDRPPPPPRGDVRGQEDGPPPRLDGRQPPPPHRNDERGPGGPGPGPGGPRFGPPGEGRFSPPPPRGAGRPDDREYDRGPGERPPPGGPFRGPGGPGGPGMMKGPPLDWQRLERDDPEMYELLRSDFELERKSLEIAEQIRQLPRDQRVKLKEELTTLVDEHFEVRQKRRELQIKRMEEELQKLRDAVAKRNESRKEIVVKRLNELTGEASDQDF